MYESFYGLKEKPFTLLPDPDYLYLSPKHQRALTLLEYGMMNHAGFSVICGDTGAGKTTLIRRLLTGLGDDTCVGLITNTHQSFGDLLNWVLLAFGLDGEGKSKAQMHKIFIEFLIDQYSQNKRTVLIVDEAQNMSADTLEELRMLSNINADKDQVLQVILAGQPALRDTLRKPELMQFAQRIAVDYYLEALSKEETRVYINHRLKVAGAKKEIFTAKACDAIYKYSRGTPRLINLLADTTLVYGFAEQSEMVVEQLVHEVVREQHSNSIIPTFNTSQPHATDNVPLQKPVAEKPVEVKTEVHKAGPAVNEEQHEKVQDEVIANLAQRAVKAVSGADQLSRVVGSQASSSPVRNQASVKVETGITENIPADEPEIADEALEKNKVTQFKARQVEKPEVKQESAETVTNVKQVSEAKTDSSAQDDEQKNNKATEAQAEYDVNTAPQKEQVADFSESAAPEPPPSESQSQEAKQNQLSEDVYPIVHIEENPKKGINMMLLGLVGGMFIASLSMMVVGWLLLGSKDILPLQPTTAISAPVDFEAHQEEDRRQMEIMSKERDTALANSRALKLERDAAIKAAETQEKIREAERRAAEILAEQEREVEKKLKEAQLKARQAERIEARALEKERELRLKAEQRSAEVEALRLKVLYAERRRVKVLAQQEQVARREQEARQKEASKAAAEARVAREAEVQRKLKELEAKKTAEKNKSFSSNPCNSPSAKFLSTCKK
ncbi:General secretion pathway protein A [hydrothermal vent metagenome]|uniref:General secretion pathway protein A n=1 Tax=hydrothermal vent metagenome TaxID=652676 RepID=A0A3B0XY58_9ZZZZ